MANWLPPVVVGSPSAAETGESGWGGSTDKGITDEGCTSFEEGRNSLLLLSGSSLVALLISACPTTVNGLLVVFEEGLTGMLMLEAKWCWMSLVCDRVSDVVLSFEDDTFRRRFLLAGGIGASVESRL